MAFVDIKLGKLKSRDSSSSIFELVPPAPNDWCSWFDNVWENEIQTGMRLRATALHDRLTVDHGHCSPDDVTDEKYRQLGSVVALINASYRGNLSKREEAKRQRDVDAAADQAKIDEINRRRGV